MFKRATSPVIAVLLLILIAVSLGVIVYAWSTGYVGGFLIESRVEEELKIVSASAKAGGNVYIAVLNTGGDTITIDRVLISNGTWANLYTVSPVTIDPDDVEIVTLTASLDENTAYTVKVFTQRGGSASATLVPRP